MIDRAAILCYILESKLRRPENSPVNAKCNLGKHGMQLRSRAAEAGMNFEAANSAIVTGLPIDRSELDKLARWIPAKEMALLYEIFDRARSDPDLTRPALLLCSAYAEKVARMLDQDPLPTVTRRIKNRLEELREEHGL